jgi:hypothetical protein
MDPTLEIQPSTNNKHKLFIVWIILLTAWMIMTFLPPVLNGRTGRLFTDPYDRSTYFERGKWLIEGTLPISEYPQIPTLLFGINHLLSSWADPNIQLAVYLAFFSLEMLFVLFLLFKVLLDLLPPGLSNYAFLLLLPPTLYFTYNRFDILPAYLCLVAYSAATKRQWAIVSIVLAIATFTKWYPSLLLPGFFMYATKLESKVQWKMIIGFTLTSGVIVFLSYIYGGIETLLAPYQFHAARAMEYIALPALIDSFIHGLLGVHINSPYFFLLFFIIQVSGPILIFFIKLDSLEALIHYCIVVTGLFVLFSRIWSPQWFLWLLPFLIILAKNIKTAGLIIAYNIIAYVSFPVIFDYYGSSSSQLQIAGLLTYLILFAIMFLSIKNLKPLSYFATV